MDKYFSSDIPISNQEEDKFQRYGFAKRIAKTIVERKSEECMVIGVYGAWGEGKTSVMNFIETELKKNENVITIKFNPWRYNDEDSLLNQFFQKLAMVLEANITTNKEKIGSLLKKYGKILNIDIPFIGGNIGGSLEGAGEILGEVDVETLKERIEDVLKEENRKVVIFIDDIDRLDKTEIHAIFRLVKLTADFPNTTYILSFDEKMVSAAIGEKFGEGNQQAGQSFLEKIIQVPLKIPVAPADALKLFCFQLVDNAINSNNIELTEEEKRRFVSEFSSNILTMLNTPRLAVRYGNTLSFSLPLLVGEVNIVDLMLIEAIKIFYPIHYNLIKANPDYFIGSYYNAYSRKSDENKKELLKKTFEELSQFLSEKQKNCIKSLLEELFPLFQGAFHNVSHNEDSYNKWYKQKRIASPKYFDRYFTYVVIKGDLSDISFQNFISEIKTQTIQQIEESIYSLVEQSSPDNFLRKIRNIEEDFDWDSTIKISKAISKISHIFPISYEFFAFSNPHIQATMFIFQLIKNHNNIDEQITLVTELITETQSFDFACAVYHRLSIKDRFEKNIFSDEQYKKLGLLLLGRAKKEANDQPLFEKFPNQTFLYSLWAEQDKKSLSSNISELLNKNTSKVIDLLRAFTPMGYFSTNDSFKADFNKKQYQFFVSIFDKTLINNIISKVFKDEELNNEQVKWTEPGLREQSDINIVRQFLHWYQEDTAAMETTHEIQIHNSKIVKQQN